VIDKISHRTSHTSAVTEGRGWRCQTAIFPITLAQTLQKECAGKEQISRDRGDSSREDYVSRHIVQTTNYICIRNTPSSNLGRIRNFHVV